MEETIIASETTSKNTFENYLQLIEKMRLSTIEDDTKISLNLLEIVIMTTERVLQDISDDLKDKGNFEELNKKTNECLLELFNIFELYSRDSILIDAISYNIMALITVIQNISDEKFDYYLRHLFILFLSRKTVNLMIKEKCYLDLNTKYTSIIKSKNRNTKDFIYVMNYLRPYSYIEQDDIQTSFDYENEIVHSLEQSLLKRLKEDYFQFGNLIRYKSLIIEDLKVKLSTFDLNYKIETLFELQPDEEYYEWSVKILFSNETELYNAKNISFLIYSFSAAIESLGDISIEIEDWGKGSRWIKLKLKISDAVSKLDLKDVLNKVRQQSDALINNKTYGEVIKFEAEAKKIEAEATKINKEAENMPTSSMASQKNELDILNQKMDIQKKYFELEILGEELKTKKMENQLKASKLINEGLIANDGNIQISINSCLYLDKTDNTFNLSNLKKMDEIEAKEEKVKKDDSSPLSDTTI